MKERTIDEIISELNEISRRFPKVHRKLKMKEDVYKKIATEAQEQTNIIEVLDDRKQPLNTICGLKIEIDNSIEKDWEVF